jgi:predicted Na+-dependent transporter
MPTIYLVLSLLFWRLSLYLLPGMDAKTRAASLFCATQKTLAFGIPFIKTAFGTRPDLAYILAPLLLYAPAQLLLGSTLIVPAMSKLIKESQSFEDGGGI